MWVSGAFGFEDDLAYFRQVLGQFAARLPGASILVREGYPVDLYPELPLRPELRFWVRRRDRQVGAYVYTGNLRVPTPRTAWRLLRRRADAVVVVEFTPTAIVTALTAHLRRQPVVQLIESDPAFRGGADGRVAASVKALIARRSRVVLASNAATARYASERLGVRPERLRVGAYLTSEPSDAVPGSDDGGPVRLLFLNSLQRRKGLHLLIDALSIVTPGAARPWTLDIVGDGPERQAIEEQVRRLGMVDRVRFHGRVSHDGVGEHYAAAHVVVCPTQGDYRSLAGFEAVNALRPVILSTRDGAAEEIVAAAPAAVAVDPTDATAFAEALGRYLGDDGHLAVSLSAAAVAPVEFSLATVGANLEAAVRAAVRPR